MAIIVEEFDAISIKNSSAQFFDETGTQQPGTKFGSVGSIEGETQLKELVKRIEGREAKKRSKPEKMTMTISAHVPVKVVRDLFGISSEGLKPGIYKYSENAKGKEFVYTADVIDEFEDVVKLIAFPRCISSTGFKFSIENGADEVALMEVEVTAYPDEQGNIMYDTFVSELNDTTVENQWHTQFNYALVEEVPTV
ncbi:phage tail protein [Bacillus sp. RO3]|nr:phage tail protein [Bacillus sp. RO3]